METDGNFDRGGDRSSVAHRRQEVPAATAASAARSSRSKPLPRNKHDLDGRAVGVRRTRTKTSPCWFARWRAAGRRRRGRVAIARLAFPGDGGGQEAAAACWRLGRRAEIVRGARWGAAGRRRSLLFGLRRRRCWASEARSVSDPRGSRRRLFGRRQLDRDRVFGALPRPPCRRPRPQRGRRGRARRAAPVRLSVRCRPHRREEKRRPALQPERSAIDIRGERVDGAGSRSAGRAAGTTIWL